MEILRKCSRKLHNQSGKSILLALLFFLLCGMAGSSILASSHSAAAKLDSNRKEQQKYFILSSSLHLACDKFANYPGEAVYNFTPVDLVLQEEPNPNPKTLTLKPDSATMLNGVKWENDWKNPAKITTRLGQSPRTKYKIFLSSSKMNSNAKKADAEHYSALNEAETQTTAIFGIVSKVAVTGNGAAPPSTEIPVKIYSKNKLYSL